MLCSPLCPPLKTQVKVIRSQQEKPEAAVFVLKAQEVQGQDAYICCEQWGCKSIGKNSQLLLVKYLAPNFKAICMKGNNKNALKFV